MRVLIREVCLVWIDGRGEYYRECMNPVFNQLFWVISVVNYPVVPFHRKRARA